MLQSSTAAGGAGLMSDCYPTRPLPVLVLLLLWGCRLCPIPPGDMQSVLVSLGASAIVGVRYSLAELPCCYCIRQLGSCLDS